MRIRSGLFSFSVAMLLASAGALAGEGSAQGSAQGLVDGFDELPLMPGLSAVKEESLSFDKPAGRIVQAVARGTVPADAVRKFYRETAPQLGWHPAPGEGRFVRDGEVLRVEVAPAAAASGQVVVRFSLSPK